MYLMFSVSISSMLISSISSMLIATALVWKDGYEEKHVTVKPDVLLMGTLQCCGAMFQY